MTSAQLRRQIKKTVDLVPAKSLASLADYVHFLSRPSLTQRIATAQKELAAGKGVNWRKLRTVR